jgi:nuclear pore complex protein Nup133
MPHPSHHIVPLSLPIHALLNLVSSSSPLPARRVFDFQSLLDFSGGGSFEEYVSCVVRTDLGSLGGILGGTYKYLAASSMGVIFRLGITSKGGQHTLTMRLFAPSAPSSSLSIARFLGWPAPSPAVRPRPANVVAHASSQNNLVLVDTRGQKWSLGMEKRKSETDVTDDSGSNWWGWY